MNTIVKPALILALVAFISSLALSHIKKITYPSIVKQEREKQERALAVVLPGYSVAEKTTVRPDGAEFVYWPASKEEDGVTKKGYAFLVSEPGYSGDVVSMVGVDQDGHILGISILQQSETPGLGARCVEIASTSTFFGILLGSDRGKSEPEAPWFQMQFTGLAAAGPIGIVKKGDWTSEMRDELLQQNCITAITGATITSVTVVKSIEKGVVRLRNVLDAASGDEGNQPAVRAGKGGGQ
jgi:electron transport complex protein RnfG